MRQIGKRRESVPALNPSAEGLRLARVHQRTVRALVALNTTGISKGIYRFASHEAMNRHAEEALARAIAANVRHRSAAGQRLR